MIATSQCSTSATEKHETRGRNSGIRQEQEQQAKADGGRWREEGGIRAKILKRHHFREPFINRRASQSYHLPLYHSYSHSPLQATKHPSGSHKVLAPTCRATDIFPSPPSPREKVLPIRAYPAGWPSYSKALTPYNQFILYFLRVLRNSYNLQIFYLYNCHFFLWAYLFVLAPLSETSDGVGTIRPSRSRCRRFGRDPCTVSRVASLLNFFGLGHT